MKRATASPAKPRASRKARWTALLAVACLLVAGAGWIIYKVHVHAVWVDKAYAADKVRFAGAEQDLADAYAAIVKAAGKPYETAISKGCGYGSVKYARGPLGCTIAYDFSYGVSSRAAGKVNGQAVLQAIDGKWGLMGGITSYASGQLDRSGGWYVTYLQDRYDLSCTLKHQTYTADEYNLSGKQTLGLAKPSSRIFMSSFSIECERDVPRALYPVEGN